MELIYVVEDDENIRDLMKIALEGFGYKIKTFETAEEALETFDKDLPDMAVFDWMLPGMDGVEAIAQIRKNSHKKDIPIMMLTAKDRELDKVQGLDMGADDYMTKPFGVLELAARIRSLLRRAKTEETVSENICDFQGLSLNTDTREVTVNGKVVELTFKEYELLHYLISMRSRVVSRDELLNKIWGYDYTGETRTLDMHIKSLRHKLQDEDNKYIKTVRGVGYRFMG